MHIGIYLTQGALRPKHPVTHWRIHMNRTRTLSALVLLVLGLVAFITTSTSTASTNGKVEDRDLRTLLWATSVSPEEMATIGLTFNVAEYIVVPAPLYVNDAGLLTVIGRLTTVSGRVYTFPDMVPMGEEIVSGLIWNRGHTDVEFIMGGSQPEVLKLGAGNMVVVGSFVDVSTSADGNPSSAGPQTCQVTCGNSAYFACCNFNSSGIYPVCKCVLGSQASSASCSAGGPGASSCSITQSPATQPPTSK